MRLVTLNLRSRDHRSWIAVAGATFIAILLYLLGSCFLGGCSSNDTPSNSDGALSPAEVAAITPEQIRTYTQEQIVALGTNIKYLSDETLGALGGCGSVGEGQIGAITPDQIVMFTPDQVRLLGAGGGTKTAKLSCLNDDAWAALVQDRKQVAALTPDEIRTLQVSKVVALGTNIKDLSDEVLGALGGCGSVGEGQIGGITAEEIVTLTPGQVRLLGATGAGGVAMTAKLSCMNDGAWAALVQDPKQVAALTADEIQTLQVAKIVALDTNIKDLSDEALGALGGCGSVGEGQIGGITADQIVALAPDQVRLLGATGAGGATMTAKLSCLNDGAWAALAQNPQQVAALTADEIPTFAPPRIAALKTNIKSLSDAALGALTSNSGGQISAITAAQVMVLSAQQISVIAGIASDKGISLLNEGAFGALSPEQIAILTDAQKASLSAAQHSACGC